MSLPLLNTRGVPTNHDERPSTSRSEFSSPGSSASSTKSPPASADRGIRSGSSSSKFDIPTGAVDAITAERLLKRIDEYQRNEAALQQRVAELEAERAKALDKEKKKVSGEVKKSKLKINLKNVQINEQLAEAGGSGAVIYNCLVDGWQCAMKEMNLRDVPEFSMKYETN